MKQFDYPIVKTLLDTDAYKIHMQQAIFYHYHDVEVVAEFICREDNCLGRYSNILLEQIRMMTSLSLSSEEYLYMSSFPFLKKEYLNWLKKFRYNIAQIKIKNINGQLKICITGLWREVILWEVPILALISEVFHKNYYPNITSKIAVRYLESKLIRFYHETKSLDLSRLNIVDFGTRRRFSYSIHYSIIKRLKDNFPFLIGTSNYHIARILKLLPVGTQAHEWFQAHQQISINLTHSQKFALHMWLYQYNNHLGIALTDCISMDAFLRDFNFYFASLYQGLRHDSGDPIIWGEKAIQHYKNLDIDPLTKTLLFSDNLTFETIISLYKKFNNRINVIFGIGTKLTCDIPYVKPLNIVIKLVQCNGKPVAKLSDSPGKTFCIDKRFIASLQKAFDLPLNR